MQIPTPPHVEDLHLVYATDKGYLFISAVSAASAARLASTPERLVIHLLDCGLDDADWERFCTLVRKGDSRVTLRRHVMDMARFAGFKSWHGSLGTYARLFLPELLPEAPWCLYVDGDTLFTENPFKALSFCADNLAIVGPEDRCSPQSRAWFAEKGFQKDLSHYFCAGFILINLDWFRAHDGIRWCMDFLTAYPDTPFPDQDALNLFCEGHIGLFSKPWGVLSERLNEANFPSLIHYVVDLPTRMRFRTRDGFRDVTAVWVKFVQVALGMSVTESCHIPRWQWLFGRAYNHLLRLIIAVLAHTPFGKRWPRMAEFQSLFIPRKVRRELLSKRHWEPRSEIRKDN